MKLKIKKYLSVNLFLLLVVLSFGLSYNVEAQQKPKPEILITFEKDEELGLAYSAQIYTDGTVIYEGKSYEVAKGKRKYKISQGKINELINEFKRINYFLLKDEYGESLEGGITTTSISLDGKQKKVINAGGPKELYELEDKIVEIAGFEDFIVNLKRQIDVFFIKLDRDLPSKGIIINYGTAESVARREWEINQAIKFRGYDVNRVKFVRRIRNKGIKTEFQIIKSEAYKLGSKP